jgi:hypothetical protein
MHFVSISASNIQHARNKSTSTQDCPLIGQLLSEMSSTNLTLDTLALADFELNPCTGCGGCFQKGFCSRDHVFNELYSRVIKADAPIYYCGSLRPNPCQSMYAVGENGAGHFSNAFP